MNSIKKFLSKPLFLSLVRDTLYQSFNSEVSSHFRYTENTHQALWLQSGQLTVNKELITAENGIYYNASDIIKNTELKPVTALRFIVSAQAIESSSLVTATTNTSELIFMQPINVTDTMLLLRLDQVDFPPAAIAFKHTHPGPGIRYLVEGELQLLGEHGVQEVRAGDAWFEDANSAVTATASDSGPSRFIRIMLLPLDFEGRSTFTLHDERDADKPRLQTNIRHVEKRISVNDIH